MSKHIVNKHFDTVEEIKKSVFHSDANVAKGEVIVYNGENPSLYVLDANGEPAMVRGNITEGDVENILSGVNEDIKTVIETMDENEIVASFALNELNLRYLDIDDRLRALEYIDHEEYKRGDDRLRSAFNAADLQLERTLDTKIKNVSSHMINGKKLNENPYINASDINVGDYSLLRLPEGSEKDIVDTDTVQMALKKMETELNSTVKSNEINSIVSEILETPNNLGLATLDDVNNLGISMTEQIEELEIRVSQNNVEELNTKISAMEAKITELENKILELTAALESLDKPENQLNYVCVMDDDGYYALIASALNVVEEPLNNINFKFYGVEDGYIVNSSDVYRVAFTTGDAIIEVNLPVNNYSMPISELEPNTNYIFEFKNDFVEITKA